jgi:large subunit ribosomal protein L29
VKAEELTVLEGHELADRLRQSRRELYELRFQVAVGQLENNRQIRKVKKDIARILTVIRLRELHETAAPVVTASAAPEAADAAPPSGEEASPPADVADTSPENGEEASQENEE